MKKKSLVLAALAVLMVTSLATALTLAYFTDSKVATNTFTVGNVKITLDEPNWDENLGEDGSMKADPGVAVLKDPTVTNDGDNEAYVRVLVTVDNAAAFKTALARHSITDLATIFAGHDEGKWARAAITEDTTANTITYVYNYKTSLPVGDNTGALFNSVTLPAVFNSADMASIADGFTITVVAQAIQADGFVDAAAGLAALALEFPLT